MAIWCTNHGQSVQTWRDLTLIERAAFDQVLKEARCG